MTPNQMYLFIHNNVYVTNHLDFLIMGVLNGFVTQKLLLTTTNVHFFIYILYDIYIYIYIQYIYI